MAFCQLVALSIARNALRQYQIGLAHKPIKPSGFIEPQIYRCQRNIREAELLAQNQGPPPSSGCIGFHMAQHGVPPAAY